METSKIREKKSLRSAYKNARKPPLSIREKIFKAQYENPFEKEGPELELFFYELVSKEDKAKSFFNYLIASLSLLLLILLFPLIAAAIKLSSSGPIVQKIPTVGKSGLVFVRYEFRTTHLQKNDDKFYEKRNFLFGKFLHTTGLYRLPLVINVLKDQMNIVGPMALNEKESIHWNNVFDDFYKRFAVKPGVIPVSYLHKKDGKSFVMNRQIRKEFRYIVAPTLKNDFKVLFDTF